MAPRKDRPDHIELVNKSSQKPVHPPKLLGHIQNQAQESAVRLLDHMFSATDDLFYDLSKRATSNNEQNLYFDAMREIRIKKKGVATEFLRQISTLFTELLNSDSNKRETAQAEDELGLSIVEGDDLEIELALNNMTGRTRDTYKLELYELAMRLDHLLLRIPVSEDNNPLDPKQISNAFVDACNTQLRVTIKARLILFKLFEKHVLKQLGHIYSDANQILLDAGILPKVPRQLHRSRSAEAPGQHAPDPGSSAAAQHDVFEPRAATAAQPAVNFQLDVNTLSALMSSARSGAPQALPSGTLINSTGPYTYYLYSSNPGPIMASPQLSSLLTKSQPLVDRQLAAIEPRNIISDVVNQLLAKRDPEVPQALEQPDEDIINLIAMFFDNVLSDESLPLAVQSLICRLQIPVLKIALHDRSFLTDAEHPARKLINTITNAGFSFDESKPLERDPLYRKIADGIQTINRLYKTDEKVIAEFLADLEEHIVKESHKSDLVEKRTTQTEEGKSRIRQARASAQNALYQKLKTAHLPEAMNEFLTNTWLQVLVITHLKHGHDSAEWVESESLVSDIMWLCQPHNDERSLMRKKRLQPEVLQRVENGLEIAIDNPEARLQKIAAIEELLASLSDPEAPQSDFAPLNRHQIETLGKADLDQKPWEDMTALERQQSRYEQLSNKYFLEAKDIPEGVWLSYDDEQTSKTVRCKLSSKIDSESYIFVNRFGFKMMEKTRRQLAYDMQFNRARILDSRPLFERLMDKVVTQLRQAA
ncbi:DUF1631 domain-containing protein [Teredinibacter turnerae]|uniref:DUF1631 domain-containing protein n=1 Tax=Teredinibacter turnerae TaxID=2426 RepID=UPI0030D189B1